MHEVPTLDVHQLKTALESPTPPVLVDVREADELEICTLPYQHHMPMSQFAECARILDRDSDLVIYCRSGRRSATATSYLMERGFTKVRNLEGGILAWAEQIDPSMPTY